MLWPWYWTKGLGAPSVIGSTWFPLVFWSIYGHVYIQPRISFVFTQTQTHRHTHQILWATSGLSLQGKLNLSLLWSDFWSLLSDVPIRRWGLYMQENWSPILNYFPFIFGYTEHFPCAAFIHFKQGSQCIHFRLQRECHILCKQKD